MKKYELTSNFKLHFGRKLFQIRALISFGSVKGGDLGGWIESEDNLAQDGNAWVYGNARVYGDAWVYDDARVSGDAEVSGNAWVYDDARVSGNAEVMWISKIGPRNGTTTFFKTRTGIGVKCGCFYGTLDEFAEQVEKTHGDNEHGRAYKLAIELAKLRILRKDNETEE